jgi:hypothetical protein
MNKKRNRPIEAWLRGDLAPISRGLREIPKHGFVDIHVSQMTGREFAQKMDWIELFSMFRDLTSSLAERGDYVASSRIALGSTERVPIGKKIAHRLLKRAFFG